MVKGKKFSYREKKESMLQLRQDNFQGRQTKRGVGDDLEMFWGRAEAAKIL